MPPEIDSWLCEAETENNPLCGSFLPRFTGLSEPSVTGNHFQRRISAVKKFSHCSMMNHLMNNLQENEEKLVKGLYITAAAHPVTQRVQKLNWPQLLHNAEEHKAGLCLTGQRGWSLHKRRITRWSVKHNQLYPVLQLLTSRDSDHHDLSPQMIIPPTSYSTYHKEAFFSRIFSSHSCHTSTP